MMPSLCHPVSGRPLTPDTVHSLAGEGERFPVLDGIAFLRPDRRALGAAALDRLDAGDAMAAQSLLLADRDDHAPGPAPEASACRAVAEGRADTLRRAMDALGYGPVSTYFAYRWSAPTFLAALGLLERYWQPPQPVIEIACGLGQILREVAQAGGRAIGTDLVFSKLWLARRFVVPPTVTLVCADAASPVLAPEPPATVICHDALYFMVEKAATLAAMRRLAGRAGAVLVGHAHNACVDQRGVGGTPLSPEGWAELMPDALIFDDAAFAEAWAEGGVARPAAPETMRGAEALALAEGQPARAPCRLGRAGEGRRMQLNPLFVGCGGEMLHPVWPTEAIAREYAAARYLRPITRPSRELLDRAAAGEDSAEIDRLIRTRVLVDLPEAW